MGRGSDRERNHACARGRVRQGSRNNCDGRRPTTSTPAPTPRVFGEDEEVENARSNLRLPQSFTRAELDCAYRRMALRFSPDKPGGDARSFRMIKASHDKLVPHARDRQDYASLEDCVASRQGLDTTLNPTCEASVLRDRDSSSKPSFDKCNSEFEKLRGSEAPPRGYGDWLKTDVADELRPPSRVRVQDLHSTFEAIREKARGTVSTCVVSEMLTPSTVACSIHDDVDTFDGTWYTDLQTAYAA